jgi:hypothetical protein
MSAVLVEVAELVAADLTAGPGTDPPRISHALTVVRDYVPRFKPPNQAADAYQVIVSPAGEETERLDRSTLKATYAIDIGICGKLTTIDNDSVDAALQVLQEMGDYFFDYGLGGDLVGDPAMWIRNDVIAWPVREKLAEDGVLFALWTAVFEGTRS